MTVDTIAIANGTGDADNYSIITGQTGTTTINQKKLSVDAITYSHKTYDGDAVADVTLSVNGTVGDETLF